MDVAMPRVPSEVTLPWLQTLWPRSALQDFRVEALEASGMSSLMARVHIESGPSSWAVVVKFGHPAETGWAYRAAYQVEADVYGSAALASLAVVRRPGCHLVHIDPTRPLFVLVLDDVPVRAGGRLGSSLSEGQVRLVVDDLARLHAAFWDLPFDASEAMGTMTSYLLFGAGSDYLGERVIPALQARFGGPLLETLRHRWTRVAWCLEQNRPVLLQGPGTTGVHGDVHPGNLLFDDPEGAPVWVDWQCVGRMQAVYDLALMLGLNVPEEMRRERQSAWLQAYVEGLSRHGIRYSVALLHDLFPVALLFAGLRWLDIAATLSQRGTEDVALARTFVRRVEAAFADWSVLDRVGLAR
ncbi:MAG: aminoglycoside phosphotransferase family protein [Clostridia bacterium]